MTCHELQRILPRIAERDGTPRVAFDAARHLASCVDCAAELLRLRELNGLLDRMPLAEVPDSFPKRVLRALRTKGGAGAILVALLALGTGGGAMTFGGGSGSILTLLAGPVQAAREILAQLARVALSLLCGLQESLGGAHFAALPAGGGASPMPHSVLALAVLAAVAFAGSWAAFAFCALRFRREQRRTDRTPA